MTDKVRIDTLGALSLNGNNETYLARQAEFESNVRSAVNDYPRIWQLIAAELQTYGGHSVMNLVRRGGTAYHEIVEDCAEHLDAKFAKKATIEQLEQALLLALFSQSLAKMSATEKQLFTQQMEQQHQWDVSFPAGWQTRDWLLLSIYLASVAPQQYKAQSWWSTGAGLLLGLGSSPLPIKALKFLGKRVAPKLITGPVGFAALTALSFMGPAYRVTLPCVVHIAMLRLIKAQQ